MGNNRAALTCNDAGHQIIKDSESLQLKAYVCPTGHWTIGYGHTGPDVTPGLIITKDKAEELLRSDLSGVENGLNRMLAGRATSNQFSAMCSLVFNIGLAAFSNSTLYRKFMLGNCAGAADEFLRWNKGHVDGALIELHGLTERRAKERSLFLTP